MQEKFKEIGEKLSFVSVTEFRIPKGEVGSSWIDCVWLYEEPVLQIFVAFEFETATTGSQIIENLVKALGLPLQLRPRFLVQIYKDKLKNKEYIETIASTLPIAIKIFDDVGDNVDAVWESIVIELFNWIGAHANISEKFLDKLEEILPKEKIVKIFHYGEPTYNDQQYLNKALYGLKSKNCLVWLKSNPIEKRREKIAEIFGSLSRFDIVILSDVSLKYCDVSSLRNFLNEEVKQKGKCLIITGGYGLTTKYNQLGKENLGGLVERGSHSNEAVSIKKSNICVGEGLRFNGFNYFVPINKREVVAYWDKDNLPALVVHKLGKGTVIIFTSDCSPSWGTPSIRTEEFKKFWRLAVKKYCFSGKR